MENNEVDIGGNSGRSGQQQQVGSPNTNNFSQGDYSGSSSVAAGVSGPSERMADGFAAATAMPTKNQLN